MSMIITNLKENPQFKAETLLLIEKAFDYSSENSFEVDFYPLMSEVNSNNCYILVEENKVKAHVGVLQKKILIEEKEFHFSMYGGIAVLEEERGKGYFKKIFNFILEKNKDSFIHLLWSDQLELYEKFNFHPAVEQFEYHQDLNDATEYSPIPFKNLSTDELKQMMKIYSNQGDLRPAREMKDWEELQSITSTQLFLKRDDDNNIINYFFMNKGEDLNGVIIEVGSYDDYEEIKKYGILWAPFALGTDYEILYATVLKIGEENKFMEFIRLYTEERINILSINKENISFKFEDSDFKLSHHEFITGVFGPSRFEELTELMPIYISGLDSI